MRGGIGQTPSRFWRPAFWQPDGWQGSCYGAWECGGVREFLPHANAVLSHEGKGAPDILAKFTMSVPACVRNTNAVSLYGDVEADCGVSKYTCVGPEC